MKQRKTENVTGSDILVIGAGIAGLSFALKCSALLPDARITVLCKSDPENCNTAKAQGGIAAVSDALKDSFGLHMDDTLRAGDGLCDPEIVDIVVRSAPRRIQELMEMQVPFSRRSSGDPDLALEGGHSTARILHCKDSTGKEILQRLLSEAATRRNIGLLTDCLALDLITENAFGETFCRGAFFLNERTRTAHSVYSDLTMIATGGIGQIFQSTTNAPSATGDGIAMAIRAGAKVSAMEFIQYHTTALYDPGAPETFLLSEALRGAGARLMNKRSDYFMPHYHPSADLACRDVVARAIQAEMSKSGDAFVYLDCRNIDRLPERFPSIFRHCLEKNIDLRTTPARVAPSAHYFCGGIRTDKMGRTSLRNLYACGECSHTGLHGANRLASNSLLEALAMAHASAASIPPQMPLPGPPPLPVRKFRYNMERFPMEKKRIHKAMSALGVITRAHKLKNALDTLLEIRKPLARRIKKGEAGTELYETLNMCEVAIAVVNASVLRKQNRGCFYKVG